MNGIVVHRGGVVFMIGGGGNVVQLSLAQEVGGWVGPCG